VVKETCRRLLATPVSAYLSVIYSLVVNALFPKKGGTSKLDDGL
jgi:hypothetical protein